MVLRIPMDLRCRGDDNSDAQHNILQTRMKINYPIHVRGWEELFYQRSIRGGRLLDRLPYGTVEYQFGGVRLLVAFDEDVHEKQNYPRRVYHHRA
eukprot:scaffold194_cov84-Skeletonema_dohrnii-CCMP3373.AAC.8